MKGSKKTFFSKYWVEERHEYLKSLGINEARQLLSTFDDEDLYCNVNSRRFQEAYISDYLEDVWGISRRSFWEHIRIGLTHPDGIVVSDNDSHIEIMKSEKMPLKVFIELLNNIQLTPIGIFIELHLEILFSQLITHDRESFYKIFKSWFNDLNHETKSMISKYVDENVGDKKIKKILA